jgi:hypothetical protein
MHKTKQPLETYVVSGVDMDCTITVNRVANPERRNPSRAIEVVVGNSSVEGTDPGWPGYQVAAGMGSVAWDWLALENCKNLVRSAKAPIVVGHILP